MKASSYLIPTAKEDPQDAVVASHKLMTRAGLIRKSAAGLYSYLPLGLRILKKLKVLFVLKWTELVPWNSNFPF